MDKLSNIKSDASFKDWVTEIKQRIRQSQIKAAFHLYKK